MKLELKTIFSKTNNLIYFFVLLSILQIMNCALLITLYKNAMLNDIPIAFIVWLAFFTIVISIPITLYYGYQFYLEREHLSWWKLVIGTLSFFTVLMSLAPNWILLFLSWNAGEDKTKLSQRLPAIFEKLIIATIFFLGLMITLLLFFASSKKEFFSYYFFWKKIRLQFILISFASALIAFSLGLGAALHKTNVRTHDSLFICCMVFIGICIFSAIGAFFAKNPKPLEREPSSLFVSWIKTDTNGKINSIESNLKFFLHQKDSNLLYLIHKVSENQNAYNLTQRNINPPDDDRYGIPEIEEYVLAKNHDNNNATEESLFIVLYELDFSDNSKNLLPQIQNLRAYPLSDYKESHIKLKIDPVYEIQSETDLVNELFYVGERNFIKHLVRMRPHDDFLDHWAFSSGTALPEKFNTHRKISQDYAVVSDSKGNALLLFKKTKKS